MRQPPGAARDSARLERPKELQDLNIVLPDDYPEKEPPRESQRLTLADISSRTKLRSLSRAVSGIKVDTEPRQQRRKMTLTVLSVAIGVTVAIFAVAFALSGQDQTAKRILATDRTLRAIGQALEGQEFTSPEEGESFSTKLVWQRIRKLREDDSARRMLLVSFHKASELEPNLDYQIVLHSRLNRTQVNIVPGSGARKPLARIHWNDPDAENSMGDETGFYLKLVDTEDPSGGRARVLLDGTPLTGKRPRRMLPGKSLRIESVRPGWKGNAERTVQLKKWTIQRSAGRLPPELGKSYKFDAWKQRLIIEYEPWDEDGAVERLVVISKGPNGKRDKGASGDDRVQLLAVRWK